MIDEGDSGAIGGMEVGDDMTSSNEEDTLVLFLEY
jgi:hypothetical protein